MSARVAERRWRLTIRLMVVAGVWALGLLIAATVVPTVNSQSGPATNTTLTEITVVQSHGAWVLALVAAPIIAVGLVAAAIVHRRRDDARWSLPAAWAVVGALTVVALLGITTVGAFMLPVAILLAVSVRLAPGWADVRAQPAARADDALASGT